MAKMNWHRKVLRFGYYHSHDYHPTLPPRLSQSLPAKDSGLTLETEPCGDDKSVAVKTTPVDESFRRLGSGINSLVAFPWDRGESCLHFFDETFWQECRTMFPRRTVDGGWTTAMEQTWLRKLEGRWQYRQDKETADEW